MAGSALARVVLRRARDHVCAMYCVRVEHDLIRAVNLLVTVVERPRVTRGRPARGVANEYELGLAVHRLSVCHGAMVTVTRGLFGGGTTDTICRLAEAAPEAQVAVKVPLVMYEWNTLLLAMFKSFCPSPNVQL